MSPRTDAFAYGVVAIELLTGLHPLLAREIIDESYGDEELTTAIRQHHDGTAAPPTTATLQGLPSSCKCKWPAEPLGQMALIATKCARLQAKRRVVIREVLPELEDLGQQ